MKFEEVQPALSPGTLACVQELGFTHMTPVQCATIPLFLTNKDVCVNALTGSGKSLAFLIPLLELLVKKIQEITPHELCKLLGLIISPTRELARQIYEIAKFFFTKVLPSVQVILLVGGEDVSEDIRKFQQHDYCIVIGTPGRIDDILSRGTDMVLQLKELEVLVMDEADTLLDMGFEKCINNILYKMPKQRRTGLFSATQTQEVKTLARAGLRNPATINVSMTTTEQQIPTTLQNYYCNVQPDEKFNYLMHFLVENKTKKAIVFFSTCAAVDFFGKAIALLLEKYHLMSHCVNLHGKMTQRKRTSNYNSFVALVQGVLFCTDVVARGIDLPDVDWIIQYDPPQDANFFVHRVGRTARAGRSGSALTFLSSNEDTYINFLSIRKIPIEEKRIENVSNFLPQLKELVISDRDILEKGTKAFIAFLRSYKEHQCQFIFRYKDLDLGAVARGFCLLQLPKINEFRNCKIEFEKSDIDIGQIKFKDKHREKLRQKQYTELLESNRQKKEKKQPQKENPKPAPRRREKKRGRHQQILEEWDELAEEELLYKKFKKGKISKEAYDNAMEGRLDNDGEEKPSKMEKRLTKSAPVKQKTKEQKLEAKKREERIRLKKKQKFKKRR